MKTMRHLFRALPLWALLLGVASCDKEDIVTGGNGAEASGERVPMTFTALAPQAGQPQTRTELQPGEVGEDGQTTYAVYWNAGDQIGIYDGESFRPFTIDLQEGETAATADFSGEALPGAESYLAFYPYDAEGVTYTDGAINFTLPYLQTAQAGSFASGVNPAWAQTNEAGGELTFRNAAALVKFTLTAEDAAQVSNAVLTDTQNKPLAGGFSLSVADGGATLKAGDSGNTSAFVKLDGNFGNTNADYLFVVACGENQLEGGFTLAFNLTNGGQKTLTASGGLGAEKSLAAGVITNLGEIPLANVPVTGVPISYGGESSAITATGEIWAD